MEKLFLTMTEVFVDTSFAIALSSVTDRNHVRAVELANQIETNRTSLVTTQAILLEIGNALSNRRYRAAAIQLLESLETDRVRLPDYQAPPFLHPPRATLTGQKSIAICCTRQMIAQFRQQCLTEIDCND
jgi:hypothetical protein